MEQVTRTEKRGRMSNYVGDAMGMFNKVKKVVQQVALNLSETEIKVEEATSNEPWGPHGTVMTGTLPNLAFCPSFLY